jgi:hypothetical protein
LSVLRLATVRFSDIRLTASAKTTTN